MKFIIAYIQPHMREGVADALRAQKIHGVTMMPCEGFGRRVDGPNPHYEDPAVELGYAPKVKIEIVCRDDDVPSIMQTIRTSAHTGHHGDGKIVVTHATHVVDIRTGLEGEEVL